MNDDELWVPYFRWLCTKINDPYMEDPHIYSKLLWQMHTTEFKPTMWQDSHRVMDAIEFRREFSNERMPEPVGIFEVMVALCDRIENETMGGTVAWDRTADWFWGMIASLGLLDMTDDNYDEEHVARMLRRFMRRRYEPNGSGSLFTVRRKDVDMRKYEIWYQAALYLNEVLGRDI